MENIFSAWEFFKSGKAARKEVLEFAHNSEDNLFGLHLELKNLSYRHSSYDRFIITDPKTRIIHKAKIRDRIVHTLAAKELARLYNPMFISQSYACIKSRGIHKALSDLVIYSRQASRNYTRNFWHLKLDIRKFFDNVDQRILEAILRRKIKDERFLWLIREIIGSYNSGQTGKGLPLGNFTSQWLANIYLNELDYFVKHELKIKYYLRYADDFVCLSEDRKKLEADFIRISDYLSDKLKLRIHEDKIILKKFSSGIDFAGYKVLPHYVLPRRRIAVRMLKNAGQKQIELSQGYISGYQYCQVLNSHLGWLKHCRGYKLSNMVIYNYKFKVN